MGVAAGLNVVGIATASNGLTMTLIAPGVTYTGPLLAINTWYHVALTLTAVSGGTSMVGYLNGKAVVSGDDTTALAAYTVLTVGGGAASGGAACLFAETCAWQRALTPQEVAHAYQYRMPIQKGLIAYGRFDGNNAGDPYMDASSNTAISWTIHRSVVQGLPPPPNRPLYQPPPR